MALRLGRRFVRAGTLRLRRIGNSKRAGSSGAGAHDLDLPGLQDRASLSLAGGRAAGFGSHAAAAAAPPARAGDGSPRKSPACGEDAFCLGCSHLILISNYLAELAELEVCPKIVVPLPAKEISKKGDPPESNQ